MSCSNHLTTGFGDIAGKVIDNQLFDLFVGSHCRTSVMLVPQGINQKQFDVPISLVISALRPTSKIDCAIGYKSYNFTKTNGSLKHISAVSMTCHFCVA